MSDLKVKIIAFALTFIFASAGAQTDFIFITGQVVDLNRGVPLPSASIFIRSRAIGTVTNEIGEFTFKIPRSFQRDTVTVSFVGYENFNAIIETLNDDVTIRLKEAFVNLEEVSVKAKSLTGNEILDLAVKKILKENKSPHSFRMDGFYRETHSSNNIGTGVAECAFEIYDNHVNTKMEDISIAHFRKIYDKKKNTDEFIDWKAGKNHLVLLINGGINLIPLSSSLKSTVWGNKLFKVEKISWFNNELVYVISYNAVYMELRLLISVNDYSVHRNELIIKVDELDYKNYAWGELKTKGEKCGAIVDHQAYEYRSVNGKMYPYYFFRKQDFRCFDLSQKTITGRSTLSSELLINAVSDNIPEISLHKLNKQKGLITTTEPYDSIFWRNYNNIQDVNPDQGLNKDNMVAGTKRIVDGGSIAAAKGNSSNRYVLKIGNHSKNQFTRADTLFGKLTPLLNCYDVKYYHLDIDVDVEKELLKGYSEIFFKVMESTRKIRIDLWEYLKINSIFFEGRELRFSRDLDAVYIEFDQDLKKDAVHSIKVSYEGKPLDTDSESYTGAFLWQKDDKGNPWAQSVCQGYGAKGWWPLKNHISDEPDSALVSVSVPERLYAVSNGRLKKVDVLGNGKKKYHWSVENPINSYDLAVHIGMYKQQNEKLTSVTGKELNIDYYFLEEDRDLALKKLSSVPQMLSIYEKYFGSYPFAEDGFKIVQSPYPMEHQSCVAVGQYFDESLILHESAHEWWGNNLSCKDNADIWINEAFATYAESLYIEETLGYSLGQEYLNAKKGNIKNDFPLVGVKDVNHFHYRIEDKYFKGALMLNTLRHLVDNDQLWFNTLKSIQSDFQHSFIDTETIIKYFCEKTKKDLTSFFCQYLQTIKIPILVIHRTNGENYQYKWDNSVDNFSLPIKWSDQIILPSGKWSSDNILLPNQKSVSNIESKYLIKVRVE